MADILIRGMEMPKMLVGEESYVDIRIFSGGKVIMASGKHPYYKEFDAVPLPEKHGRLGDFIKQLRTATGWRNASEHYALMRKAADVIEALEVIIPAEGGIVIYVLRNCPEYGLKDGYCILGIKRPGFGEGGGEDG